MKQNNVSDERGKDDTRPVRNHCPFETAKGVQCGKPVLQGSRWCEEHDHEMRGY